MTQISIKAQIAEILNRWDQYSAEQMIQRSREGKLPESEFDAISLTNLLQRLEHLQQT